MTVWLGGLSSLQFSRNSALTAALQAAGGLVPTFFLEIQRSLPLFGRLNSTLISRNSVLIAALRAAGRDFLHSNYLEIRACFYFNS